MKTEKNSFDSAGEALKFFLSDPILLKLEEIGSGHINDTFLVTIGGKQPQKYILQRLNSRIFKQPELIMANFRLLYDHIDLHQRRNGEHFSEWQKIKLVSAPDGRDFYIDQGGHFWRMVNFIEGKIYDRIAGHVFAFEAGRALGLFHRLVFDLDPGLLVDTLPGFHDTPGYLADYDELFRGGDSDDEKYCVDVVEKHRDSATVLEEASRKKLLPVRVIHGDPRLENILFDSETGRALTIIDLDTVKPGLLHYDIGDCLRSCCNVAGEDGDNVRFDAGICSKLLLGYVTEMGQLMSDADFDFIYPAVRLLAFELGLRFFADHLAGDIYFKTNYKGQNLRRAMAQFKLLASIEESEGNIRGIIEKLYRFRRAVHDLDSM